MFRKPYIKTDSDSEDDHPVKSQRLSKISEGKKFKTLTDNSTSTSLKKFTNYESSIDSDSEILAKPRNKFMTLSRAAKSKLSFTISKSDSMKSISKVRNEAIKAFMAASNEICSEKDSSKTCLKPISRSELSKSEMSKIKPIIGKIPHKQKPTAEHKSFESIVNTTATSSLSQSMEDQSEIEFEEPKKPSVSRSKEKYLSKDREKNLRRSLEAYSHGENEVSSYPFEKPTSRKQNRMCLPSYLNPFQRFAQRSNMGNVTYNPMSEFMTKYESLSESYFDTHCHPDYILKQQEYTGSFESYMNDNAMSTPKTYKGCLAIFCDPKEFKCNPHALWNQTLKVSNVYGSVGCHPKKAKYYRPYHDNILEEMLDHPKCKAIGEIGLDYSGSFAMDEEIQKRILHKHLKMAIKKKKPIVIHSRDADDDIVQELLKHDLRLHKIHRHCFTGNVQTMKNWLQIFPKSFVGFTPLVTYDNSQRCLNIRECVKEIPLNKLLIETDSPYFLPSEIPKNYFDNNTSYPPMAVTVAAEIASIRGITTDEVLFHCRRNVREMYGIIY